jgi:hypothetical protein
MIKEFFWKIVIAYKHRRLAQSLRLSQSVKSTGQQICFYKTKIIFNR